jgi:hypothetical protein
MNLKKDGIFIKMDPKATRSERNQLSNELLALIDDKNLVMVDTKSFIHDI